MLDLYRASITFDGPSDGGANYKAQITAFGGAGVYVAVPIIHGDVEHAKRECISIAAHLVKLINDRIDA